MHATGWPCSACFCFHRDPASSSNFHRETRCVRLDEWQSEQKEGGGQGMGWKCFGANEAAGEDGQTHLRPFHFTPMASPTGLSLSLSIHPHHTHARIHLAH